MDLQGTGIETYNDGTFGDNIISDKNLKFPRQHEELRDHVTNFIDTAPIHDLGIYVIKNGDINDFGKTFKITMYEYNIFYYDPVVDKGIMRWQS